jgi:hypothetical protein
LQVCGNKVNSDDLKVIYGNGDPNDTRAPGNSRRRTDANSGFEGRAPGDQGNRDEVSLAAELQGAGHGLRA